MRWVNRIINYFIEQPNKLFLTDAVGALTSAIFLNFIIAKHESIFGMPEKIVHLLAIIALLFSVYSIICFLFVKSSFYPFIRFIAILNTLYCCITFALLIYFYSSLTSLGIIYFIGEIFIILSLARIEMKIAEGIK